MAWAVAANREACYKIDKYVTSSEYYVILYSSFFKIEQSFRDYYVYTGIGDYIPYLEAC